MAHMLLFGAMIAGFLFWAAACVALAARTERPWLRRLLVVAGVLLAPLALLPAVGVTAYLAFRIGWPTNWFAPTLTAFPATAIGGWWIYRAGLSRAASGAGFVANAWPVFGLAAMPLAGRRTTDVVLRPSPAADASTRPVTLCVLDTRRILQETL